MDEYRRKLLQLPAGMGAQPQERSLWDKIADQFRAQAAPSGGKAPKIDQDKAKAFVKGFQGN